MRRIESSQDEWNQLVLQVLYPGFSYSKDVELLQVVSKVIEYSDV